MAILLIETATERGLIAIFEGSKLLFESQLPFGYQQSKYLMPEIERGFKETGLIPKEIQAIGVGIGPGSYTGMRIGAAAAKALAFALEIPLIGVSSLQAFVPQNYEGSFTAIIDAKIGGAYLLKGQRHNGKIDYVYEPVVCPLDALSQHEQVTDLFVTPNEKMLKKKIAEIAPDLTVTWQENQPDAKEFAARVQEKIHSSNYSHKNLELLYLRKTEAEREKEARHLSPPAF